MRAFPEGWKAICPLGRGIQLDYKIRIINWEIPEGKIGLKLYRYYNYNFLWSIDESKIKQRGGKWCDLQIDVDV